MTTERLIQFTATGNFTEVTSGLAGVEKSYDITSRKQRRLQDQLDEMNAKPFWTPAQRRRVQRLQTDLDRTTREVQELDLELTRLRRRRRVFQALTAATGALAAGLAGVTASAVSSARHLDQFRTTAIDTGIAAEQLAGLDLAFTPVLGEGLGQQLASTIASFRKQLHDASSQPLNITPEVRLAIEGEDPVEFLTAAVAQASELEAVLGSVRGRSEIERIYGGLAGTLIELTRDQEAFNQALSDFERDQDLIAQAEALNDAMRDLDATWTRFTYTVGQVGLPAVEQFNAAASRGVSIVSDAIDKYPILIPIIQVLGAAFLALAIVIALSATIAMSQFSIVTTISLVRAAASGVVSLVSLSAGFASTAAAAVAASLTIRTALIATGIGAILVGIATAIALVIANWDTIKAHVFPIINQFGEIIKPVVNLYIAGFNLIIQTVNTVISAILSMIRAVNKIPGVDIEVGEFRLPDIPEFKGFNLDPGTGPAQAEPEPSAVTAGLAQTYDSNISPAPLLPPMPNQQVRAIEPITDMPVMPSGSGQPRLWAENLIGMSELPDQTDPARALPPPDSAVPQAMPALPQPASIAPQAIEVQALEPVTVSAPDISIRPQEPIVLRLDPAIEAADRLRQASPAPPPVGSSTESSQSVEQSVTQYNQFTITQQPGESGQDLAERVAAILNDLAFPGSGYARF